MALQSFLVGYDLNRPHKDYPNLIDAIKALSGGTWWHHLDSTWIFKSELTAEQLRDVLVQHIDANDELLVVGLTGEGAWRIARSGSDWLLKYL
jgi:hypothetical protein